MEHVASTVFVSFILRVSALELVDFRDPQMAMAAVTQKRIRARKKKKKERYGGWSLSDPPNMTSPQTVQTRWTCLYVMHELCIKADDP